MPDPTRLDACDLLDADHLAVKHLFVRYACLAHEPGADDGASHRAALAQAICRELTVHAAIEEEIFYPALREAAPAAAEVLDAAEADHARAKALIERIQASTDAGAARDAWIADLARVIEDHVKEERDELFPKARAAAALDLPDLGRRLRERQAQLLQADPAPA